MINQSLINARIVLRSVDGTSSKILRITSNPTLVDSNTIGCDVQHLSTGGTPNNGDEFYIVISGITGGPGTSGTSGESGHNARMIYSSDTNPATLPDTHYIEMNSAWSNTNQTRIVLNNNVISGDVSGSLSVVHGQSLTNSIIVISAQNDPSSLKVFKIDSVTPIVNGGVKHFDLTVTHLSTTGNAVNNGDYVYVDILPSGKDGTSGSSGQSGTRGTSGSSGFTFSVLNRSNGATPTNEGRMLVSRADSGTSAYSADIVQLSNYNAGISNYNTMTIGNFTVAGTQKLTTFLNTEVYSDYSFTASKAQITGSFRGTENNTSQASFTGLASSGSLIEVFTSSTNYTKKLWAQKITVICIGAGGGGGGGGYKATAAIASNGGGGGGGGSIAVSTFSNDDIGSTVSITVPGVANGGGAGNATINTGGNGNDGGDAKFGTLLVAHGGYGGSGGATNTSTPTAGGAAIGAKALISTGGGPGGNGGHNATIANWASKDGSQLPYHRTLPFNGSSEIPSSVAPTGGGGGAGYTAANVTAAGGNGGAIATSTSLILNNVTTTILNYVDSTTTSTGATAPSVKFHYPKVKVGLGGRGGSTTTLTAPAAGASYGGGGGGGYGGGVTSTGTITPSSGANGGPGVVIVITE